MLSHSFFCNVIHRRTVLSEHYEVDWFAKVTRTTTLNGQGGNKRRTYRLFKNEIKCEHYLKCILNGCHRITLAKCRCDVAPILYCIVLFLFFIMAGTYNHHIHVHFFIIIPSP